MASNLNLHSPRYIVKFPDINPPGTMEVSKFSNYMPVESFSIATHMNDPYYREAGDGQKPPQVCVPVRIQLHEKVRPLIEKLLGQGLLKGKEVTCIELGRDDDDEHTERFKQELKGVTLTSTGGTDIEIEYQEFESEAFYKDAANIPGGYDFLKQKKTT
jgi:hypothetical protein